MNYYALENVVYKADNKVVCVITPVWLLKGIASSYARAVAEMLNKTDMDERDVLRGSLD